MSLTKRIPEVLGLVAALVLAGGCETLNVKNPNAPDAPRIQADPATWQSVALGAMRTWYNTQQGGAPDADPTPLLAVMAKSHTAAWNNFNIRFYTGCTEQAFPGYPNGSCYNASQGTPYPRVAWQNDPASRQRTQIEPFWYGYNSALSSANDVLRAIRKGCSIPPCVIITDAGTTKIVEIMAVLVQGLALSGLSMNYDQAFVVDEDTPLDATGAPIVQLKPRKDVRDAAVAKFDQAIALAKANTFTVPATFFNSPALSYDNVKIAQIANTMAARTLAYYPRDGAENADMSLGGQVDWARVASYADSGISSSITSGGLAATPFDWIFHEDGCVNWCDYLKVWTNDASTMRVHTRVAHLLDPASQEDPWPTDNPNTTLASPVTASASPQAATPVSMQFITTGRQLKIGGNGTVIDTVSLGPPVVTSKTTLYGEERVVVTATTPTTFTGVFTKNHPATTLSAAITAAPGYQDVTPASMTDIQKATVLSIDNPREQVTVKSITATTFRAKVGKDHPAGAVVGVPAHRNRGANGNDNPSSPDHRLGDGTFRGPPAYACLILCANPDTNGNGGYDFVWSFTEEIQNPARGLWHQSAIGQVRYDSLAGCGDNPQKESIGTGDAPVVLAAENDLIWAEALLRKPGPNAAAAANLINFTRHGPDRLLRPRGNLPLATGTLAEVQYEQDVELMGSNVAPYYNQRRIDNLEPGTPHEMPVPAKELGVLSLPLYTWGGVGGTANSNPTAPARGAAMGVVSLRNVQQVWAEMEHEMLTATRSGRGFRR